jgi:hypothetical protein
MEDQDWKAKYLKLADAVTCVVESYDYKEVKDLRCRHGEWYDEECGHCINEFLDEALEQTRIIETISEK